MANQEKQQKRGFMYVSKSSTGKQKKKELVNSSVEVEVEEKKPKSRSWLPRISKTRTPNADNGGRRGSDLAPPAAAGTGFVEARKSTSFLELVSADRFIEGRKSVSSLEAGGGKGRIVGGRKSVSDIERNLEAGEGRIVDGRKSVSQIETLSSTVGSLYLEVKVLVTDMPSFMQVHAFRCARRTFDSLEQFSTKHIAYNLKKEFDKAYGPAWHCIVGSNFGSFVTHSTGCFLYFSMEKLHILLFKTKVKKVLD